MDFAAPTTAAKALERFAEDLRAKAKNHRRDAHLLLTRAEELENAAGDAESDARRYERYQPKEGGDGPTTA